MRKIKSWLRRLRGISTPFGGLSWDAKQPDPRMQAFAIGFDLHLLWGLAFSRVGQQNSDTEAYEGQRTLLVERAAQANISVSPPTSVAEMSPDEIAVLFAPIDRNVEVRLQARNRSLARPYWLGRWLAQILSATAAGQIASPEQVQQLYSPLLARYDDAVIGARQIGAGRGLIRDLSALRDRIAGLSKKATVTSKDYAQMYECVLQIFHSVLGNEDA